MFLNQRRVIFPSGSGLFDLEPLPPAAGQKKSGSACSATYKLDDKDDLHPVDKKIISNFLITR
ncbi:hypothetical protein J14TS2_45740 [Bacillus sp. J14TS2]|nr:hypothetical protein J14TS2_45740 [Bacillus sp. J14TS2]